MFITECHVAHLILWLKASPFRCSDVHDMDSQHKGKHESSVGRHYREKCDGFICFIDQAETGAVFHEKSLILCTVSEVSNFRECVAPA